MSNAYQWTERQQFLPVGEWTLLSGVRNAQILLAREQAALEDIIRHALRDAGTVLIPAFSIGRTQELLYELEDILYRNRGKAAADDLPWDDLEIVLDSPLAARFTDLYRALRPYWDDEARTRIAQGRHPLNFDQLTTIDSH